MRAVTSTLILTIFAFVMTAIVIVVVFTQIWPLIRFGPFSPCWGVFVSDINSFSIWPWEESKSVDFHLCDVVGELDFVNRAELEALEREIGEKYGKVTGCEEGYEAYIIGVPFKEEDIPWYRIDKELWEKIKKFWQEKMGGIKPVCNGLEKAFKSKPDRIPGPTTGSTIWCVTFSLEQEGYVVSATEGKCGAERGVV